MGLDVASKQVAPHDSKKTMRARAHSAPVRLDSRETPRVPRDPVVELFQWAAQMGPNIKKLTVLKAFWILKQRLATMHNLEEDEVKAWVMHFVSDLQALMEKHGTEKFMDICTARMSGECEGSERSIANATKDRD